MSPKALQKTNSIKKITKNNLTKSKVKGFPKKALIQDLNNSSLEEEKLVEEVPQKKESWLDHIPIFDWHPDLQEHLKLSKERKEKRYEKVYKYCLEELYGIFEFAFDYYVNSARDNYENSTNYRSIKSDFRKGKYIQVVQEKDSKVDKKINKIKLFPYHSLDIESYIRQSKSTFMDDLSNVYGKSCKNDHLSDANDSFCQLIECIQAESNAFITPFSHERMPFPFVISVVGPQYGGRTTICQLLYKLFNFTYIECIYTGPADHVPRRKKSSFNFDIESILSDSTQTEIYFKDAHVIKYSDEKQCLQQLVQIFRDLGRPYGIVISGFPNTKTQLSLLEKSLGRESRPNSTREMKPTSKQNRIINGIIFALNTPDPNDARYIDPDTGFVYSNNICVDSSDLIGEIPADFYARKAEIENRFVTYPIVETMIPVPKVVQSYQSFANSVKKHCVVKEIYKKDSTIALVTELELFVNELTQSDMYTERLANIVDPIELRIPAFCYDAIEIWKRCLSNFGMSLADRSNLIKNFFNRVEVLSDAALNRFKLLCSLKDERIDIDLSNFSSKDEYFTEIWNKSISRRNEYIEVANRVVEKSGLLELVLSLLSSPLDVFILLVEKMAYVIWHSNTFKVYYEINDYDIFRDPKTVSDPPYYNFFKDVQQNDALNNCTSDINIPLNITHKERIAQVEKKKEKYLLECFPSSSLLLKPFNFDLERALSVLEKDGFSYTYEGDIIDYSNKFFDLFKTCDGIIKDEITSSKLIIRDTIKEVDSMQVDVVNCVFDLRDRLIEYAHTKVSNEMEMFSRDYSSMKPQFRFFIPNDSSSLLTFANTFTWTTIIQDIISDEIIDKLEKIGPFSSLSEFLQKKNGSLGKDSILIEFLINILECSVCFNYNLFIDSLRKCL